MFTRCGAVGALLRMNDCARSHKYHHMALPAHYTGGHRAPEERGGLLAWTYASHQRTIHTWAINDVCP